MTADYPEFLSTREAAKYLGLSLTTVQLWVEAGVLPAWKTAGGHRRIPREAVEQFQAKRRVIARPESTALPVVLVVEDDLVELTVYQQKFADLNLPVRLVMAEDGFNGLIEIGRHSPALILTDLDMPGMDGFEMIRRISARQPRIIRSLVVVTGLSPIQIKKAGGLPDAIPVYSKPIALATIKAVVEQKLLAEEAKAV
jgi:excisionase family DNA binding protein